MNKTKITAWHLLTNKCVMTRQRKAKRFVIVASTVLLTIALSAGIIGHYASKVEAEAAYEVSEIQLKPRLEANRAIKTYTPAEVKELATKIANANGLDTDRFLKVIKCESGFQQFRTNANKDGSVDRGVAMWNSYWHSKLTDNQAYDVDYSLNKMAEYWKAGRQSLWVCYKLTK